jgi:hypothetical protein
MNRSTCRYCGASREILEKACPYCGRAYDDAPEGEGDLYEEILEQRGILFESSAVKRLPFWAHLNCRLRITKERFIFDDFDDDAYSFTIPMAEMRNVTIENPRGWLASSDDMLIIREDGTEHEIGLEPGVKPKVVEIVSAVLERYY